MAGFVVEMGAVTGERVRYGDCDGRCGFCFTLSTTHEPPAAGFSSFRCGGRPHFEQLSDVGETGVARNPAFTYIAPNLRP